MGKTGSLGDGLSNRVRSFWAVGGPTMGPPSNVLFLEKKKKKVICSGVHMSNIGPTKMQQVGKSNGGGYFDGAKH